ncbi:MAG: hypothetical protein DRO12_03235 [Thermoprotei archaeon]|nr:MAG: hypothetical protein DRO12_03235 [Thermoprotei archaeon]
MGVPKVMTSSDSKIVLAVAHMRIELGNKKRNLERLRSFAKTAHESGAKILVLPSFFNIGPVLSDSYRVRISRKSMIETVPGITADYLCSVVEEYGLYIVTGPIIERQGSRYYLTSLVVAPLRGVMFKYRKIFVDRDKDFLSPGRELPLLNLGFSMGMLIEEDILIPELATMLVLNGARLLIVFQKLEREWLKFRHVLITRALENHVKVIGVGGIISRGDEDFLEIPTLIINDEGVVVDEVKGFEDRLSIVEINSPSSATEYFLEIKRMILKRFLRNLRSILREGRG